MEDKSLAGRRALPLPNELFDLLIAHKATQAAERAVAGTEWHDGDWIFAQPNGAPIDPRRDHDDWKELLRQAGVRKGRLHNARRTAATALLILGVPERAVMEFMGWSSTAMTRRYQHVTGVVRRDVAERINGYLWSEK